MMLKIKINTYLILCGAICIQHGECCGVCMKCELQEEEIISKNKFGIETRRFVKAERMNNYLTKENLFGLHLKR